MECIEFCYYWIFEKYLDPLFVFKILDSLFHCFNKNWFAVNSLDLEIDWKSDWDPKPWTKLWRSVWNEVVATLSANIWNPWNRIHFDAYSICMSSKTHVIREHLYWDKKCDPSKCPNPSNCSNPSNCFAIFYLGKKLLIKLFN